MKKKIKLGYKSGLILGIIFSFAYIYTAYLLFFESSTIKFYALIILMWLCAKLYPEEEKENDKYELDAKI